MSPVIWCASRDDHLAILTAIIDGDEDRAEHAMRDHVRQTATLFAGLPESSFANRRSEEHTSELQSLMRISYAVFCLKKKTQQIKTKIKLKQQNNEKSAQLKQH